MGATVSIVNKTQCVLYIAMTVGVPYYWQDRVEPGETMVRQGVGHVWFTITANAWNGDLSTRPTPQVFTNLKGDNFTLIHDFGLKVNKAYILLTKDQLKILEQVKTIYNDLKMSRMLSFKW